MIREQNSELAHQWMARATAADVIESVDLAATIALTYATLAVADALAIVHREIAYVGECVTGSRGDE